MASFCERSDTPSGSGAAELDTLEWWLDTCLDYLPLKYV
jgi:hypothetical protein